MVRIEIEKYKFENNCGCFREIYRGNEMNLIEGKLKPLTGAHYHLEGEETYIIEKGIGTMKIKCLEKGKAENYDLRPGTIITVEPNEIHQVRSAEDIYLKVISCPPWKKENEIEIEESLF